MWDKILAVADDIERIIFVTTDCLRWDHHAPYRDLYPPGIWYRATPNATFTPSSHTATFTGLNAPRHGVFGFGDVVRHDNLLSQFDAVSYSLLTSKRNIEFGDIPGKAMNFPHPRIQQGDDILAAQPRLNMTDLYEAGDHDLFFFHDWVLHRSGEGASDFEWTENIMGEKSPAENQQAYETMRDESLLGHDHFLAYLKQADLYDDSLFVFWGDHGQAFGDNEEGALNHAIPPFEGVARVPIGFCSPLFEDTHINTRLNPRGIDIAPTVCSLADAAGIDYEAFSHAFEGIDLTTAPVESLLGYCISGTSHLSGGRDGVRSREHGLVTAGQDYWHTIEFGQVLGKTETDPIDWLKQYYTDIRTGRTTETKATYDEEYTNVS